LTKLVPVFKLLFDTSFMKKLLLSLSLLLGLSASAATNQVLLSAVPATNTYNVNDKFLLAAGGSGIARLGSITNYAYSGILNFRGNGGGLTNLTATNLAGEINYARLPFTVVTNNMAAVSLTGTFTGTGVGLTNLAATNLIGSIDYARLPFTVVTNNMTNVALIGAFTGNGAGLTNIYTAGLRATNVLTLYTNDALSAAPAAGSGVLWNSNGVLFWITASTTNQLAP
jgi:hypothetical protein